MAVALLAQGLRTDHVSARTSRVHLHKTGPFRKELKPLVRRWPLPSPAHLPPALVPTLEAFRYVLHHDGVYAALCYLNRYTPHRYTGIYRFEDGLSRNVALVDRYNIQVQQGADVPLDEAFCSLVGRQQATLQLWNAPLNLRAWEVNTLVVFYCGVLICDKQGQIYGTLCHYDLDLCQEVPPLLPPLEAAAPLLYQALHATSAPATNQ